MRTRLENSTSNPKNGKTKNRLFGTLRLRKSDNLSGFKKRNTLRTDQLPDEIWGDFFMSNYQLSSSDIEGYYVSYFTVNKYLKEIRLHQFSVSPSNQNANIITDRFTSSGDYFKTCTFNVVGHSKDGIFIKEQYTDEIHSALGDDTFNNEHFIKVDKAWRSDKHVALTLKGKSRLGNEFALRADKILDSKIILGFQNDSDLIFKTEFVSRYIYDLKNHFPWNY